jgi:hypothetical protein
MANNGISTLTAGDGSDATANKEARQIAKLNLAQTRRQAGGDTTQDYYRTLNVYDRIYLPEGYNVSAGSQVWAIEGRPWYDTAALVSSPLTLVTGAAQSLQIWFDGADITQFQPTNPSDAQGITQWNDKSNFAHNANPEGSPANAVRPTYQTAEQNSLSVVEFDGANDCLSINPVAWVRGLQNFTLFIVAKYDGTASDRFLSTTDTDDVLIKNTGTEVTVGMAGATAVTSGLGLNTSYHRFTLVFDGTASGDANRLKFRLDGSQKSLTFTGTVGTQISNIVDKILLGCGDGTGFFDGQIAEVIAFQQTLDSTDLSDIEGYLATKWSI